MTNDPKNTGKKKVSLFDSVTGPFTWVIREVALPDTLLRMARSGLKKKKK